MASNAVNVEGGPRRKGKGRAVEEVDNVSETTPLLASSSSYSRESDTPPQRRLYTLLGTVFLSTLSISLILLILLGLLAYSYKSRISDISPEEVLDKALVVKGPNRLNVLNVTEGQLWLRVDVDVGVDVGEAVGVNSEEGDDVFRRLWKACGRWGVQRLESVTVDMASIEISSMGVVLGAVEMPEISLPLSVNPPKDSSWLTPMSLPILIRPTFNSSSLLQLLKESWRHGSLDVSVSISELLIHGGQPNGAGWRRIVEVTKKDILADIKVKIPYIPGLPRPGDGESFPTINDFLSIRSFDVVTEDRLQINLELGILNPLPKDSELSINIPSIPVQVSLPRSFTEDDETLIPIIAAQNSPLTLSSGDVNVSITVVGTLLPITPFSVPLISRLVSTFLRGATNSIVLSTPIIPGLFVPYDFRGPNPRPKILRNVTIKDMRIKTLEGELVASGIVYARVVLPKGIDVMTDVKKIWPDVLVFDGEPEDFDSSIRKSSSELLLSGEDVHQLASTLQLWDWELAAKKKKGNDKDKDKDGDKDNERPPLPSPLPERAFARIRPDDWLEAESTPIPKHNRTWDEGAEYDVSATIADLPLEILPGRDAEFRKFIGKVIFGSSEGALTGVKGVTAVAALIKGFDIPTTNSDVVVSVQDEDEKDDSEDGAIIQLTDLPVTGLFRVGRKF